MASPPPSPPASANSRPVAAHLHSRPSTPSNKPVPRPNSINRKTHTGSDGLPRQREQLTPDIRSRGWLSPATSTSSFESTGASMKSDGGFDTSTSSLHSYASAATTPDEGLCPLRDDTGTPCKPPRRSRVRPPHVSSLEEGKAEEMASLEELPELYPALLGLPRDSKSVGSDAAWEGSTSRVVVKQRKRQPQIPSTQCWSRDEDSASEDSTTAALEELYQLDRLSEERKEPTPAASSDSKKGRKKTTERKINEKECSKRRKSRTSAPSAQQSHAIDLAAKSVAAVQNACKHTITPGAVVDEQSGQENRVAPVKGIPEINFQSGHEILAFRRYIDRGLSSDNTEPPKSTVNSALYMRIRKGEKMTTSEGKKPEHGFIYIFESPWYPGMVKIGMTKRSPHERRKEWNLQCKMEFFPIRDLKDRNDGSDQDDENDQLLKNYNLVEKLIHLELGGYRRKFTCPKCEHTHRFSMRNKGDKGVKGVEHGEWFEIDQKTALLTIRKWRDWIVDCDPYDSRGQLKCRWDWKLDGHIAAKRASPDDFLKPFTPREETIYFLDYTHQLVKSFEAEWKMPMSSLAFLQGGLVSSVVVLWLHQTIGLIYGSWVALLLSIVYFISKSRR